MAEAQQSTESKVFRVLVSVDNSENSEAAFNYYFQNIHKPENEVIVLHVSDQVKIPTYALFSEGAGFDPVDLKRMVEELHERNKKLEHKYNTKCNELQIKHKVLVISEDPHGPGHAICESAKKHKADLIVVGSRGLGTIRRTILGSVSTYVIHHSHIPTIVHPVVNH